MERRRPLGSSAPWRRPSHSTLPRRWTTTRARMLSRASWATPTTWCGELRWRPSLRWAQRAPRRSPARRPVGAGSPGRAPRRHCVGWASSGPRRWLRTWRTPPPTSGCSPSRPWAAAPRPRRLATWPGWRGAWRTPSQPFTPPRLAHSAATPRPVPLHSPRGPSPRAAPAPGPGPRQRCRRWGRSAPLLSRTCLAALRLG
mmetsp:Transcript_149126/g.477612  ORF Transcript_149126/g.477612 Transcript_149126/m.477612 type:complete len:200 (-) Transcript_149126:404-1003(-)